jgi:hypothetical protein
MRRLFLPAFGLLLAAAPSEPEVRLVARGEVVIPAATDHLVRSVLGQMYRAYDESLELQLTAPPVLTVNITNDEAEFGAQYGGRMQLERLGGFYNPRSGEAWVVFRPERGAGTERVLFHEVSHRLLHASLGGAAPQWLHEGLAEVFERAEMANARLVALPWLEGHAPLRAASEAGTLLPMSEVLRRHEWFDHAQVPGRPWMYEYGWGVVAMLLSDDEGRAALKALLKQCRGGCSARTAGDWLAARGGGYDALDARFKRWLQAAPGRVLLTSSPEAATTYDGPQFKRCGDGSFVIETSRCPQ